MFLMLFACKELHIHVPYKSESILCYPKNSLLYNSRPALVDFRRVRTQTARQNLEQAFSTAEREFGVTRLLDPEGKHCWVVFLSHLLLAGCDIGVQISVRPSVRSSVRPFVRPSTFTSKFGFLYISDSYDCETLHSNCP